MALMPVRMVLARLDAVAVTHRAGMFRVRREPTSVTHEKSL
jgi:hypothetical protein